MARRVLRVLLATLCLLLVPLVAMQFTSEVAWTALDFAVAGVLILSTGLIYEFAICRIADRRTRLAGAAALAALFLLVWAQLAVGIF